MVVVGADPGLSGACSIVSQTDGKLRLEHVVPMPTMKTRQRGALVDARALESALSPWRDAMDAVVIEQAGARPAQGIASAFSFGRATGTLEGTLQNLFRDAEFTWVSAARWKRDMRVPADKTVCMTEATLLFGDEARQTWWPTKARSGAAESALLCAWRLRQS